MTENIKIVKCRHCNAIVSIGNVKEFIPSHGPPLLLCVTCFANHVDVGKRMESWHMDEERGTLLYFNQVVESIKDMDIDSVREFIIKTEAEIGELQDRIAEIKVKYRAQRSVYHDKASKLSLEEREARRLDDMDYSPEKRELKAPVMKKVETRKQKVTDIEERMKALLGEDVDTNVIMKNMGLKF